MGERSVTKGSEILAWAVTCLDIEQKPSKENAKSANGEVVCYITVGKAGSVRAPRMLPVTVAQGLFLPLIGSSVWPRRPKSVEGSYQQNLDSISYFMLKQSGIQLIILCNSFYLINSYSLLATSTQKTVHSTTKLFLEPLAKRQKERLHFSPVVSLALEQAPRSDLTDHSQTSQTGQQPCWISHTQDTSFWRAGKRLALQTQRPDFHPWNPPEKGRKTQASTQAYSPPPPHRGGRCWWIPGFASHLV